MKRLKKGGDFKSMRDSNMIEVRAINELINQGWEFASKAEWKEWRTASSRQTKVDEPEMAIDEPIPMIKIATSKLKEEAKSTPKVEPKPKAKTKKPSKRQKNSR